MRRRDVLKFGGLSTVGLMLPASLVAAEVTKQVGYVIVDPRFTAALVFGNAARAAQANVLYSDGDLATLWYGDLRGPSSGELLGLTGYADMVVASGIAAEARRPFRFRMSHQVVDNALAHRVSIGTPSQVDVLDTAGEQWPLALWSMMASRSGDMGGSQSQERKTMARKGALWSWAIA